MHLYSAGAMSDVKDIDRKNGVLEIQQKTSLKHLISKREAMDEHQQDEIFNPGFGTFKNNEHQEDEIFNPGLIESKFHSRHCTHFRAPGTSETKEFRDRHQSNIKADRVSSIMHMNDAKEVKCSEMCPM